MPPATPPPEPASTPDAAASAATSTPPATDEVLGAAAPDPADLQDAIAAQPDGPNVAPSAHEHDAARGLGPTAPE